MSIDDNFTLLLNNWIKHGCDNKYYFIITKCCGYEFLVPIYKNQTMSDLFYNVESEHQSFNSIRLYINHSDMKTINNYIPSDDTMIKDWIEMSRNTLTCTTKIPNPVAYRLWLDDEHTHCTHNSIINHN